VFYPKGTRQMPPSQGTSLQQSAPVLQLWPYSEHTDVLPPLPPAPPLPPVPPDPPEPPVGGSFGLHVPLVEPIGRTHVAPGQQSALIVHAPALGTQVVSSGGSKQRSAPFASGTHGKSSQQSSADAQVSPLARHSSPRPLQRGTPSPSS
jgi:hypothetical protein